MAKKIKDEPTSQETMHIDEIQVITTDPGTMGVRGGGPQTLKVEELAVNVNLFVQQMGKVLESTPEKLGKFHFDEFEIHAEISADGTIAVLGTGVHAGIGGGLRFVFRRGTDVGV
ncbi:MAG: hypothetical protein PVS3B3_14440 [Ktedonobacteraceae bacterium]